MKDKMLNFIFSKDFTCTMRVCSVALTHFAQHSLVKMLKYDRGTLCGTLDVKPDAQLHVLRHRAKNYTRDIVTLNYICILYFIGYLEYLSYYCNHGALLTGIGVELTFLFAYL